ncbi:hypothetical protein GF327_04335 [Candidatus Woesearchaeota archaeon]|nr:hypothetical protein [Candidatus Woesearchaeota archaeon]
MKPLNNGFLYKYESKLKKYIVPRLPGFMDTEFLTYMSLVSSFGIFLSYYLARDNLYFLFLVCFFIFSQWLTDILDGAVGRYRKQGLVKWGYFMDHLFDYIFFSACFFGFYFFIDDKKLVLHFLVLFFQSSLFFIITFLNFGAAGKLRISLSKISISELRLIFIVFNLFLIIFGKETILSESFFTYLILFLSFVLLAVIIRCQKKLKKLDLKNKNF